MWLFREIRTLGDLPRHYAKTLPRKAALIDGTGSQTFAELDTQSNRLANAMLAQGLPAETSVAYLGENTARYFEVLFGVNKAGCALLPLNWRLAVAELAMIVEDAGPGVLIADKPYRETAEAACRAAGLDCRIIEIDSTAPGEAELDALMAAASDEDPAVRVDPWQTAILMYTSGTTGKPKGVQMAHQGVLYLRLCEHLEPSFNYDRDDVMLTVMPLFHAMGVGLSLQALYNGGTVAVRPMPEPGELLAIIARERPTVLPLVPTAIQMMLDHPEAGHTDLSCLRLIVYAGSPMGPHLLQRAMDALQCDFIQFYGATETHSGVTFLRPEDHRSGDAERLKSCGSPLPLIDIEVVDAQGKELPVGEVGEFLIRSPSLTTGYYRQPETTAAAFTDGWYRSGDAGYKDAEGYLYLVDRVKDMIISGGENVYSTEVENALQKHADIQGCAAIGLPDEKWGERVVAVVQLREGAAAGEADIITHCRELIAGYKTPKQIIFRDALPMTASGKVMKKELREELRRQREPSG